MTPDRDCRDGSEWFCILCGRRLYTLPPAAVKSRRADQMAYGELRAWVKRLVDDGLTVGAIALIVNREPAAMAKVVRQLEGKGRRHRRREAV